MSKTDAMIEAQDFAGTPAPATAPTAKTMRARREEAAQSGLYHPGKEHDACGVGLDVRL